MTYTFLEERARVGAPVLFTFHGTGGDERQFAGLAASILPGATHIAPRGDVNEHGALRFFRRTGEGIYDMDDLAARTDAMAGFVADRKGRLGAPEALGLGYSNGANILASMRWHRPGLIRRAALLHPLIPFRPAAADLSGLRVLITAGRRDPICPVARTTALAERLREDGAEVDLVWHDGGHEIRPEEIEAAQRFLAGA